MTSFLLRLVTTFVLFCVFNLAKSEKDPFFVKVRLHNVVYKGRVERVLNQGVAFFLGMRYAEAPKGRLRFKKAIPAKVEGEKWAVSYGRSCHQRKDNFFGKDFKGTKMWNVNTYMDEDCLFLNVWSPIKRRVGVRKPLRPLYLPVMVWIYGGGFHSGTSSLDVYQGQWLAAAEEVVVVSMNYRVAALGFLSFGTESIPGNAGLWDQREALIWVQKNIHKFGGDRNKVTLFGSGAGAASVNLHMLSGKCKGLFRNAILQSASAFSPWAVLPKHLMKERAKNLTERLKCDNTDEQVTLECLYAVNPQVMVDTEIGMSGLGISRFQSAAVVDEDFLTSDDIKRLENGTFVTDINVLAGFNKNEGNYFLIYGYKGYNISHHRSIDLRQFRDGVLRGLKAYPWKPLEPEGAFSHIENHQETDIILHAIDYQYGVFNTVLYDGQRLQHTRAPPRPRFNDALDRIIGDLNCVCPVIRYLRTSSPTSVSVDDETASSGKKFLYEFLRRSSKTPWPKWMGTLHGYEIEFVFGMPLNNELNYAEEEVELSQLIMHYWANFARTGNPNSNGGRAAHSRSHSHLAAWTEYNKIDETPLLLDTVDHVRRKNLKDEMEYRLEHEDIEEDRWKVCSFWNDYYLVMEDEMVHVESLGRRRG